MDDTIIDMRDVFLKRQIRNLPGQDTHLDAQQDLLNEIYSALKIMMNDIDLHLIENKDKQMGLHTVQRCLKEVNKFIEGNRS